MFLLFDVFFYMRVIYQLRDFRFVGIISAIFLEANKLWAGRQTPALCGKVILIFWNQWPDNLPINDVFD